MNGSVQVLAIIIVLPFIAVILRLVRRRKLRAKYSFLWLSVGGVILAFSLAPGLVDVTANKLGVLYGPAILFLGAIVLLLFLAVHFSWELSRLEDRTRTLAEELGLANSRISELEDEVQRRDRVSRRATGDRSASLETVATTLS